VSLNSKMVIAILFTVIITGIAASYQFTRSTEDSPWYRSNLAIDGPTYIRGMAHIRETGSLLHPVTLFQSPGYQIFLGMLYRNYATSADCFRGAKLFAWGAIGVTIAMIVFLGATIYGPITGWLAGALLAWSFPYWVYANCLQYEVWAGLFLTSLVLAAVVIAKNGFRDDLALLGASIAATLLCFLNARYLTVIVAFGAHLCSGPRSSRRRNLGLFLFPFLAVTLSWSVYQSLQYGHPLFISSQWGEHFTRGNNLRAYGSWVPVQDEPAGLAFIWQHPGRWLHLFYERWMLLWGLASDPWHVEPMSAHALTGTTWMKAAADGTERLFLFTSVLGLIVSRRVDRARPLVWIATFSLLGPLVFYGSARYLIPTYPLLFLMIAHLWKSLWQRTSRFVTTYSVVKTSHLQTSP
jgi:hypothetical protein